MREGRIAAIDTPARTGEQAEQPRSSWRSAGPAVGGIWVGARRAGGKSRGSPGGTGRGRRTQNAGRGCRATGSGRSRKTVTGALWDRHRREKDSRGSAKKRTHDGPSASGRASRAYECRRSSWSSSGANTCGSATGRRRPAARQPAREDDPRRTGGRDGLPSDETDRDAREKIRDGETSGSARGGGGLAADSADDRGRRRSPAGRAGLIRRTHSALNLPRWTARATASGAAPICGGRSSTALKDGKFRRTGVHCARAGFSSGPNPHRSTRTQARPGPRCGSETRGRQESNRLARMGVAPSVPADEARGSPETSCCAVYGGIRAPRPHSRDRHVGGRSDGAHRRTASGRSAARTGQPSDIDALDVTERSPARQIRSGGRHGRTAGSSAVPRRPCSGGPYGRAVEGPLTRRRRVPGDPLERITRRAALSGSAPSRREGDGGLKPVRRAGVSGRTRRRNARHSRTTPSVSSLRTRTPDGASGNRHGTGGVPEPVIKNGESHGHSSRRARTGRLFGRRGSTRSSRTGGGQPVEELPAAASTGHAHSGPRGTPGGGITPAAPNRFACVFLRRRPTGNCGRRECRRRVFTQPAVTGRREDGKAVVPDRRGAPASPASSDHGPDQDEHSATSRPWSSSEQMRVERLADRSSCSTTPQRA
jgi:hypothetical protein